MKFLRCKYVGNLELSEVMLNLQYVVSVQKTKSGKFGSIITMDNGEKYPIEESYESVIELIKTACDANAVIFSGCVVQ